MKKTLYGKESNPWWVLLLREYRYKVLVMVIILVLIVTLAWAHNPVELEGVYHLQ